MRRQRIVIASVLAAILAVATTAAACLWDTDTLQMERMRFPGALEIITGKFVRHSRAYYEWRIADRLKKLESAPGDSSLIDDLAVGYDKLGRYDEGIAVLENSLAADPNRYETLANLATLLFHAGRIEESKQHVERALEINPNAHFGREKYQLLLTDYVLQSQLPTEGVLSTEDRYPSGSRGDVRGFARFVLASKYGAAERPEQLLGNTHGKGVEWEVELQNAARGVLGMLHFADHQSPVLLEALGDLLIVGDLEANGTQIAARAYLRAAQLSNTELTSERLRAMARQSLENQTQYHGENPPAIRRLEQELSSELAAGTTWFAKIERQEQAWIAAGADVDREFAAVYYDTLDDTIAAAAEQVSREPVDKRPAFAPPAIRLPIVSLVIGLGILAAMAAIIVVVLVCWNRGRKPDPQSG
jgi:tetratricopeptide (TPR) repeat protein